MKPLSWWCLTVLLTSGRMVPAGTHPPLQDLLDQSCAQDLAAHAPSARERHAAVATVAAVDHHRGLLTLQTEGGWIVTAVAPDTIKELQVGDQILVCLAEEAPA